MPKKPKTPIIFPKKTNKETHYNFRIQIGNSENHENLEITNDNHEKH